MGFLPQQFRSVGFAGVAAAAGAVVIAVEVGSWPQETLARYHCHHSYWVASVAAGSVNVCGTKMNHWRYLHFDDHHLVDFAVIDWVLVAAAAAAVGADVAAAEVVKDAAFERNKRIH